MSRARLPWIETAKGRRAFLGAPYHARTAAWREARRAQVYDLVVVRGLDRPTDVARELQVTVETVRKYWPDSVKPSRRRGPDDEHVRAGVERDADVLDSLRSLGETTVRELAEDTGRNGRSVSKALVRLARAGKARKITRDKPALWASVEGE